MQALVTYTHRVRDRHPRAAWVPRRQNQACLRGQPRQANGPGAAEAGDSWLESTTCFSKPKRCRTWAGTADHEWASHDSCWATRMPRYSLAARQPRHRVKSVRMSCGRSRPTGDRQTAVTARQDESTGESARVDLTGRVGHPDAAAASGNGNAAHARPVKGKPRSISSTATDDRWAQRLAAKSASLADQDEMLAAETR